VQQALQSGRRTPLAPIPTAAPAAPTATTQPLRAAQDQALRQLVAEHTGSRAELAARLGLSERSLYRRLKALGDA
jgi:DNA-binding NtrC family response regulator